MNRHVSCLGRLAIVALSLVGCGPDCADGAVGPECPTGGWLSVMLDTPNVGDGGVMFVVSGGRIDSIASAGYRVFWDGVPSQSADAIVAGNVQGGTVARIYVPDTSSAALYSAVVTQVAASGTWEQRDPAGYAITVSR